jgi:hypothetical protein
MAKPDSGHQAVNDAAGAARPCTSTAATDGGAVPASLDRPPFTPGPWRADKAVGCKAIMGNKLGAHKQAQYATEVACTPGLADDEVDRANANLIAASPEMFDALTDAALVINAMWSGTLPPCFQPTLEMVNSINGALARARGEA